MTKEELYEKSLRLLVSVIGVFIICIVLFIFKLNVNAESPSGSFPYVVPSYQDLNSAIPSDIYLQADSLVRQTYNLSDTDTVLWFIDTYDIVVDELGDYGQNSLTYIINPSTRGYTQSFDYLSSTVNVNCQAGGTVEFRWTGSVRGPYGFGGGTKSLLGPYSTSSITHGSITRLYPFYMSGPDALGYPLPDGGNDPIAVIFTNYIQAVPDEFQTGHAQEPNYDSDTIIDSSLHPNIKPTFPTINNYTFNNYSPPSIDTSNIESLLESIWDNITYSGSYLVSNIGCAINNLNTNVNSLITYVGDLSSYLASRIVNTIKQTANSLFENFRDLFEPTLNSFANLVNIFNTLYTLGLKDDVFDIPTLFGSLFLPNESDLDLLLNSYFTDFDTFVYFTGSIKSLMLGIFDTLNDDPTYSIHIAGFTYHGISIPQQEISFDWYLPYKSTGDIFISAFLIVGYLYWLFTRIAGIFHGMAPDANMASHIADPYTPSGSNGYFDY